MYWNVQKASDRLLVSLKTANLDASMTSKFREEILPLIEGDIPVVIDMGEVKFVDSSGLGALCSIAEKSTPVYLRITGVTERLGKALSKVPALAPFWMPRPTLAVRTA